MNFNSTENLPSSGDDDSGRRLRIAAYACIALLTLLLIWVSLGNARIPWSNATAADSLAPGTGSKMPLRSLHAAKGSQPPALRNSQLAHARRPASLAGRRAVGNRRSSAAAPVGETPATAAPPSAGPAPTLVSSPPSPSTPAPTPGEPPAPVPSTPEVPAPETPTPEPPPSTPPTPDPTPQPPVPQPPTPQPPGPATPVPQEPTPAPEPGPAPLFNGARIDDFDEIQAAPGAVTETADPLGSGETVLKLTVSDDDVYPTTPTENPRAQALSPSLIDEGDEFWLSTKVLLPQDFPSVPGWLSLVSIYGPPFSGSSPWQIGVSGNEFTWERNSTYGYDVPWRMPLIKGRWVSILLHERFADDGWVEMWVDGKKASFFPASDGSERLSMRTMDSSNDDGPNSAKIMLYREAGMFDSASVYFGALKIGQSVTSVTG